MKEILERINGLATAMEQKNAALDLKMAQVSKSQESLEEMLHEAKALAKDLTAREKKIKTVEDLVTYKQAVDKMKADTLIAQEADAAKMRDLVSNLSERELAVSASEAKLSADRATLTEGKKKLEENKETYKAQVLKAVQKDLDKAKGKTK